MSLPIIDRHKIPVYFVTEFNAEYHRCTKCHREGYFIPTRPCVACGRPLCRKCYHAGFCQEHFFKLEELDRDRIEQLSREGVLCWFFFVLGLIITILLTIGYMSITPPGWIFWGLIPIVTGGTIVSILIPWQYERYLRSAFWKAVGSYDLVKMGQRAEVEAQHDHMEDQEDNEGEENTEDQLLNNQEEAHMEIINEIDIAGDLLGEVDKRAPPTETSIMVCEHCGWMLMTADSECPRCGYMKRD